MSTDKTKEEIERNVLKAYAAGKITPHLRDVLKKATNEHYQGRQAKNIGAFLAKKIDSERLKKIKDVWGLKDSSSKIKDRKEIADIVAGRFQFKENKKPSWLEAMEEKRRKRAMIKAEFQAEKDIGMAEQIKRKHDTGKIDDHQEFLDQFKENASRLGAKGVGDVEVGFAGNAGHGNSQNKSGFAGASGRVEDLTGGGKNAQGLAKHDQGLNFGNKPNAGNGIGNSHETFIGR